MSALQRGMLKTNGNGTYQEICTCNKMNFTKQDNLWQCNSQRVPLLNCVLHNRDCLIFVHLQEFFEQSTSHACKLQRSTKVPRKWPHLLLHIRKIIIFLSETAFEERPCVSICPRFYLLPITLSPVEIMSRPSFRIDVDQ